MHTSTHGVWSNPACSSRRVGDALSVSLGLAAFPVEEHLLLLFCKGLPLLSVFPAAVQQGQTVL